MCGLWTLVRDRFVLPLCLSFHQHTSCKFNSLGGNIGCLWEGVKDTNSAILHEFLLEMWSWPQQNLCSCTYRPSYVCVDKVLGFYSQEIWLILPVVICLFQGLSHASVRVLGVYLERSVYGSLNGLLSTQRRMCICHPNGITLLTAKLIPVRRTSYLPNSGVTSGLLHCGARCASPKQKPTPFFGSLYCWGRRMSRKRLIGALLDEFTTYQVEGSIVDYLALDG